MRGPKSLATLGFAPFEGHWNVLGDMFKSGKDEAAGNQEAKHVR